MDPLVVFASGSWIPLGPWLNWWHWINDPEKLWIQLDELELDPSQIYLCICYFFVKQIIEWHIIKNWKSVEQTTPIPNRAEIWIVNIEVQYLLRLQPTTYNLPPTTYYLPPTTYYLQPKTYHLQFYQRYFLPPTTYLLPPTNYNLPPTTY